MLSRNSFKYFIRFGLWFLFVMLAACSSQIKLQPLSDSDTIVAFGDSLTYGTGATLNTSYPAVL